jgi:cell division control protein 6
MMPREKTLDPRILSFPKKTNIIFEPYDALDLLAILQLQAEKALRIDRVDQAKLKKVAAYASRETGDARKAVELLAKGASKVSTSQSYETYRGLPGRRLSYIDYVASGAAPAV